MRTDIPKNERKRNEGHGKKACERPITGIE